MCATFATMRHVSLVMAAIGSIVVNTVVEEKNCPGLNNAMIAGLGTIFARNIAEQIGKVGKAVIVKVAMIQVIRIPTHPTIFRELTWK